MLSDLRPQDEKHDGVRWALEQLYLQESHTKLFVSCSDLTLPQPARPTQQETTNPCLGIRGLIKNENDPTHQEVLHFYALPSSVVLIYAKILEDCQIIHLFLGCGEYLFITLLHLPALHNIFFLSLLE